MIKKGYYCQTCNGPKQTRLQVVLLHRCTTCGHIVLAEEALGPEEDL